MARFPYYKSNIRALGKLLAHAATDPEFCTALKSNPNRVLADAGLPPETTELLNFSVVKPLKGERVAAIPFKLNGEKLSQQNPEYLDGIAKMVQ